MAKRPQAGSAAAGSDADAKKAKPPVHVCTLDIMIPFNTDPESPKLSAGPASKYAARNAEEAATEVLHIKDKSEESFELFATPFAAAVAAASTEKGRPVTMLEVTTAIAQTGCKLKISKRLKERFAWDGFKECRWQISREIPGYGLVAFPKGAQRSAKDWRLSPSPAAPLPLVELSCEPSPRSSTGCVVC